MSHRAQRSVHLPPFAISVDFAMSLWRASVSTHGAQDRAPRCMRARHTAFALPGPLLPASMALLVRPAHRLFKSPRMRGMAGTRLGIHATFGWKMRSISGVHPAFSACGRLRTLRTRGGCAHAKIGDLAPCAWVGPHHAAPVACLWVGGGPSGVSSVLNQLLPISLLCNEMGSNHCVWGLRPMSTRCMASASSIFDGRGAGGAPEGHYG